MQSGSNPPRAAESARHSIHSAFRESHGATAPTSVSAFSTSAATTSATASVATDDTPEAQQIDVGLLVTALQRELSEVLQFYCFIFKNI